MAKISSKKTSTKTIKKTKQPSWAVIDPEKVFRVTKERKILLGGEAITEVDLKNLQAEVGAFKKFKLWEIFDHSLRQMAIETGFINSETWERTMAGKMMLHNLGIMRSIMDSIMTTGPLHTAPVAPKPPKVIPTGIASL